MRSNPIFQISRIMIAMLLLLISSWTIMASFISSPLINPGISTIYTDQDLVCHWTINESANANISWYKNSYLNTTYNRSCISGIDCYTEGNGIISQSFTTKGDVWTCDISYYTEGSPDEKSYNVTIADSVPTLPRVYFSNGTEAVNTTIYIQEDNTTTIYLNSTDADNDPITYTLQSNNISCSIDSSSGAVTCNPTEESQVGISMIRYKSEDANTGATRGYVNSTINVTPTNDPPYFSPALQNKSVNEADPLNYIITGADIENPWNIPFTFSMSTNMSSVVMIAINSTAAKIIFNNSGSDIATYNDKGNHTISVTITDNGTSYPGIPDPRNFTRTFILQVNTTNQPANLTYNIANQDNLTQFGDLLIYFNASDRENDTLTFYTNNAAYPITMVSNYSIGNISYANAIINITNMSNYYVINHIIAASVFDSKQNTTLSINLTIHNVNDPPEIYDNSYYALNSMDNTNISALQAYTGVALTYKVNASDPDDSTYDALNTGIKNYTTNDSRFPIDINTGIISFTPNQSGNYSFTVTVTDANSSTANKSAHIDISVNHPPYFLTTPIIIYCNETDPVNWPSNCTYNLSRVVNDSDIPSGDFIKAYTSNSTMFTIDDYGMINFYANQTYVGTHSILFNVTDNRSASNSTIITLIINNTNNAPNITSIATIPSSSKYVGAAYTIRISASDLDLQLPSSPEILNFSINASGPDPAIFSPATKINSTVAQFSFAAAYNNQSGKYSIDIKVRDMNNNYSVQNIQFIIYNNSGNPIINNITPFGYPLNYSVNTSWMSYSSFAGFTNITIDENSSYTFDQNTIANTSNYPGNSLTFEWEYDGTTISSSPFVYLDNIDYFNFQSQGNHILTFKATDSFNKTSSFNWSIKINNVNRPPILANNLDDLIVNGSGTYPEYMLYYHGKHFYDPDDDIDNNGTIDPNENNTLTFSMTSCDAANLSITGTDKRNLYVKTLIIGECYVNFTAFDATNNSMNVTSYDVLINVTAVSNESTEIIVPTPTPSSGGGGSSIRTVTVPIPEEVETPKPLQIITPKLVTVYQNSSVKVPIILNNTWNDTLEGVSLHGYTNASNVSIYLDKVYFPRLLQGKSEEVTLIINNYKSEGHYEIQISANVTNPQYEDVATIFVNSADMKSEGDEVENKISFARDLLSSNPECQELTELLNQAKNEITNQHYDASAKLVDDVINGCKYLMSNANTNLEKPSKDFVKIFEWNTKYNEYMIIGAFGILFVIALYYVLKKEKPDHEF